MKITDLNLDSFSGLPKIEPNGIIERFYMILMNTVKVRYNESTGEVLSLNVNGTDVPLDDQRIISQFNSALRGAARELKKPQITMSDLKLSSFSGLPKIEPNGIIKEFYMIGMNTVEVRYNESTGVVSSLKVNGQDLPLDNSEIIEQFNTALSQALGNGSGKRHI